MDKLQDFKIRKEYIETTLGTMLGAKHDFDFIKYAKAARTEEEFFRIGDLRGCTVTFDITGTPLEAVMGIVCDYVVSGPLGKTAIKYIVAESDKLISIAPLFKREVA